MSRKVFTVCWFVSLSSFWFLSLLCCLPRVIFVSSTANQGEDHFIQKDGNNNGVDSDDNNKDHDSGEETTSYRHEEVKMRENNIGTFDHDNNNNNHENHQKGYGIDVSWPIQHLPYFSSNNEMDTKMSLKQFHLYNEYMNGCYHKYSKEICYQNELNRIRMNQIQPMYQKNYTSSGYAKIRLPNHIFIKLQQFYQRNQVEIQKRQLSRQQSRQFNLEDDNDVKVENNILVNDDDDYPFETWEDGNIHLNHWDAPTKVLPLNGGLMKDSQSNIPSYSSRDKHILMNYIQNTLEKWTNVPLIPTSMYGIRIYQNNSILSPHIDRLPLVISAIINVAQEGIVDDWVLELINHDGIAVNITMEPGDVLLYESHSIIHGRPYPLNGKYYANLFFHFEPIGYSHTMEKEYKSQQQGKLDLDGERKPLQSSHDNDVSTKDLFEKALQKFTTFTSDNENDSLDHSKNKQSNTNQQQRVNKLPPSVKAGTIEASRWLQEFTFFRSEDYFDDSNLKRLFLSIQEIFKQQQQHSPKADDTQGVTSAHKSAARGDLKSLQEIAKKDLNVLNEGDENGWKPIHEAARAGHVHVIEYLLNLNSDSDNNDEFKIDINEPTNNGATALWLAEQTLEADHKAILLLRKHGAKVMGPNNSKKQDSTTDE